MNDSAQFLESITQYKMFQDQSHQYVFQIHRMI